VTFDHEWQRFAMARADFEARMAAWATAWGLVFDGVPEATPGSYLYVAVDENTGLTKVGSTGSPPDRIRQLERGWGGFHTGAPPVPRRMRAVRVVASGGCLEASVLRAMDAERVEPGSEWLRRSAVVDAFAEAMSLRDEEAQSRPRRGHQFFAVKRTSFGGFVSEGQRRLAWEVDSAESGNAFGRDLGTQGGRITRIVYGDRRPGLELAVLIQQKFGICVELWCIPPLSNDWPSEHLAEMHRAWSSTCGERDEEKGAA
jgi:hypothetical protein